MPVKIRTSIVTDDKGQSWPLIQFGPVADEDKARAMLKTMCELIAERFSVEIELQ